MGGKRNQAQRTKNNVKPSSSSRSANVLGKDAAKLVTFATLKENVFSAAKVDNLDEIDAIDPNFQVAFKKLNKKDAITKQKGLQELTDLCKSSSVDVCKAILPYWPSAYCTLSLDSDNKVREWSQLAHRALVTRVGRDLAPYLRRVMPVWFISQYDTYPPAASAATNTFQSTFPTKKIKEVITFCQDEILNYLLDNLLTQTPQSLGKSDTSKEDMEAKYERVVICCLNGYAQYLQTLPFECNEKIEDSIQELFCSPKFWKFASNSAPLVRAAWFSCLNSFCKHNSALIEKEAKNVAKTVFSNLDEQDPVVLPLVWEASLHSLVIIKDCEEHVSVEKVIFPKLCNILENGGQGNAGTIYPNLLPFLSSIANTISKEKIKFYDKFFHSILTGLKQTSVKLSQAECETIISTFMECFRYVTMLNNEERELCLHLFDTHWVSFIREVIVDSSYKNIISYLFVGAADLVHYWQRSLDSYPLYNTLMNRFWTSFTEVAISCAEQYKLDHSAFKFILSCHMKFFKAFLDPCIKNKKMLKVKFEPDPYQDELHIDKTVHLEPAIKSKLEVIAKELLALYYSLTKNESKDLKACCIEQLSHLVKMMGFDLFLSSCGQSEEKICEELHCWLQDPDVPVEPILVLTFCALVSVKSETLRQSILFALIKIRPESLVVEAVKLCRSKEEHSEIRTWLKSDSVKNVLLKFTLELKNNERNNSFNVLKFCLSAHKNNEYIVGDETMASILDLLAQEIIPNISCSDNLIILLEHAFNNDTELFYSTYSDRIGKFLVSLFNNLLCSYQESPLTLWRRVFINLMNFHEIDGDMFKKLTDKCTTQIIELIDKENGKGISRIKVIVAMIYNFIECSSMKHKDKEEKALEVCAELLELLMGLAKVKWEAKLEQICHLADKALGRCTFEELSKNEILCEEGAWDPLRGIQMDKYAQVALVCVEVIFRVMDEESFLSSEESHGRIVPEGAKTRFHSHILSCMYSLTLLTTAAHFSSTSQYFKSVEFADILPLDLKDHIQRVNDSSMQDLILMFKTKESCGNLWMKTSKMLENFLEKESEVSERNHNERIATEGLEESSIRSLRFKLKNKGKDCKTHVSFMCWKFTVTCKAEATVAFEVSLNSIGILELCLSAELARFLAELISSCPEYIEPKTWDFIIVATASWVQSVHKTSQPHYYQEYVGFVMAVCDLLIALTRHFSKNELTDTDLKLKTEWNDVFAEETHVLMKSSWKLLADKCSLYKMEPITLLHIERLSDAIIPLLDAGKLVPKEPGQLVSLAEECSRLILSTCPSVQITSFLILRSLAPHLAKLDIGLTEKDSSKLSCLRLKDTLLKTQIVVEAMLQDFELGVMCLVTPFTDSYVFTLAYLLQWLVLLEIFKSADSQAKHLYSLWLKEETLMRRVMGCLIHLFPDSVIVSPDPSNKNAQKIFSVPVNFCFDGWSSEKLAWLSCQVYCQVLRVMPLLSRQWYSEVEPKVRDFVDPFTSAYVSPLLIAEEIVCAKAEGKTLESLSIESLPAAREVTAIYSVEESKSELGVMLAANHPFCRPDVDISRSVGTTSQNKNKLKQITLFPILQNGSIWDCIIVWKNYLDKKFEGAEECCICYSLVHHTSNQLPRLTCRTCKKKFHSGCLYKWFTSSNKSTCPICRNLF